MQVLIAGRTCYLLLLILKVSTYLMQASILILHSNAHTSSSESIPRLSFMLSTNPIYPPPTFPTHSIYLFPIYPSPIPMHLPNFLKPCPSHCLQKPKSQKTNLNPHHTPGPPKKPPLLPPRPPIPLPSIHNRIHRCINISRLPLSNRKSNSQSRYLSRVPAPVVEIPYFVDGSFTGLV